jgi:urease gamma subunit
MPGQPGAAGAVPVDTKDPKVQAAMKKSQSGQNLNPDEQKLVGAVAASTMQKESRRGRRRLGESEIQQAQVVLAAQDMVDQIQKMLEQISAMQFKDLPALTDSIKNDMGVEQATSYQSATAAALTQLLQSVQQGKTALEGAQGTLTGQAPVVPGQEDAANMDAPPEGDLGGDELNPDADMGMPPEGDLGGDELNPAADMGMPPEGGDEATDELGNATSLGRGRRGVAEAKKKGSKPDFLDVDKDGDKKEPFKKAVGDKKAGPKKGVNPFAKKK